MSFDRDQLLSISELRAAEAGMTGKSRGNCTVSLPEMRRAGVGVCLATLLCRALPKSLPQMNGNLGSIGERRRGEVILREDLDHANQSIASAAAQGQLAYYRLLEEQGQLRMIRDAAALDEVWGQWERGGPEAGAPIGYILSMEGTDPIVDPRQAEWWWEQGLRTACLAHYGPSAYAMGTGGDGPLTARGRELLQEFERLGMVLDLVHTADTAFAQALDIYSRPVFISHGNCRSLVPHDRQISDEQIQQVAARGGVIGAVLDAWMLAPDYRRDDPNRPETKLIHVADHIDHVCQVAGNARHSAIGSDLDGGFGTEQSPTGLDTIADLQKLAGILSGRGYGDADIDGIFHGNWLRFFRETLPGA
jgi:membrane dipeptidase